jgi:hypothetical protein
MANNYTTSTPSTVEFQGDSVGAGTIPSTYDIIITPDAGYVVQASDFSIGSTLPTEVTTVAFSDTTTALDPSNQVRATVTLAQWYTMPATTDTIEVDIDGSTHTASLGFNYKAIYSVWSNLTSSFAVTTVANSYFFPPMTSSQSTSTSGSVKTETCYIGMSPNQNNLVGIGSFTCANGYHFATGDVPTYAIASPDPTKWTVVTTGVTTNAQNQTISISFAFYYDIDNTSIPLSNGETIRFLTKEPTADSPKSTSVNTIRFDGYKDSAILPTNVNSVNLIVGGTSGATYNLKIEDSLGQSYNFDTNLFSRASTVNSYTIDDGNPFVKALKNTHELTLPTFYERSSYTQYWTATVTPTGTTKSKADGSSTDPITTTLYQFGDVDFTLGVTASDYGVDASSTTIISLTDQLPLSYPSTFNPTDFPLLSTNNNGYFSYSQDLGYNVSGTVAEGGNDGSTTVTLTATAASLKLQVGDSVFGANVAPSTTIATIADPATGVIVLSTTPLGTIANGTALTFVRTVGISRQPATADFFMTTPFPSITGQSVFSRKTYSVKYNTVNSTVVSLYDPDGGDFSDIGNNASDGSVTLWAVSGNSISGFPSVVNHVNGHLVLSSNQTLTAGDLLHFTPVRSELVITKMEVTGAGTTTCKLNVDGYIARMGYDNVIALLLLNNFVTTYAAPTAATISAGTYSCPLGGTIKIDPRSQCTGHTGTLTIATIPSKGAGEAVITSSGEYFIYQAPDTDADLSDVISYTVNDGINTSASANITITLTE